MKCETAKNWLTQCDSLQARTWPRKIVRHVKHCRPCRHFARGVLRLEEGWRHQPLPVQAKKPSAAFLQKIDELEIPTVEVEEAPAKRKRQPAPAPLKRAHWPSRWVGAIAAMLLLSIGVFAWLLLMPGRGQAAGSDVVERLIDFNVEMANTEPKKRPRLMQELEPKFREDLAKARLSEEDRQFADSLLEKASELVTSDDPVKEEEYIEKTLKAQLESRVEKAKEDERERCGSHYTKFLACNMSPMFQRAYQAKLNRFGKDGPDNKGFDKGGPDNKGFDKRGFDKRGFDRKGFDDYLKMQMDARNKALEMWRQKGGPGMKGFPGPGMGHKH